MKYIISTFILAAISAMSFRVNERIEFPEFFKQVFDKSYSGLENLKDPVTGKWEVERAVGDFDACEIRYDIEKGVYLVQFTMHMEEESAGDDFLNRLKGQVEAAIPVTNYRLKRNNDRSDRMIYEYDSQDIAEKAKNPVVELSLENNAIVVRLYEPFNRQKPGDALKGK